MNIPISEAKAKFAEIVRRAEAGEEIVLTRNGKAVARISDFDDKMDRFAFFGKGEVLEREEIDTEGNGKRDTTLFFEKGKRVRQERDADGNGIIELVVHYDGDEIRIREEVDSDVLVECDLVGAACECG